MKEIQISVRNKIALNRENDTYVCGNTDYKVVFDFDEEWEDSQIKTARFKYNGQYQEVVFTGNECPVPLIQDARLLHVGVYAGNLRTSTPAVIIASRSILCGDDVHTEPEPDVYNQLTALVEELRKQVEELKAMVEGTDRPKTAILDGAILDMALLG